MKKYFVFFMVFICLTGVVYSQTEDDFDYEQNRNGKITITKFLNKEIKDVVIPSKIRDIEVSEIGKEAFGARQLSSRELMMFGGFISSADTISLNSVSIPSTVEIIGDDAFNKCGLNTLTISNGVISIGAGAFSNNNLSEVILPNSITGIGENCFENNKITNITFSNKLKVIPSGAFNNNLLEQLIIPEGITIIGEENYGISKGLDRNFSGAFQSNKLVYIKLPKSITSISRNDSAPFAKNPIAFIDCPNNILDNKVFSENLNIIALNIGSNFNIPAALESSFINFYASQGKKAGIYIKDGKLWKVGTQTEFDNLVSNKLVELKAEAEAKLKIFAGYDKVEFGSSVEDVRKAYTISEDIKIKYDWRGDPYEAFVDTGLGGFEPRDKNKIRLNQQYSSRNISNDITSRDFYFFGNTLWQVSITYVDSSDRNVKHLLNQLSEKYGDRTDYNQYSGVETFTFGKYAPTITVQLVFDKPFGFAALANNTSNSLKIVYTSTDIQNDYNKGGLQNLNYK